MKINRLYYFPVVFRNLPNKRIVFAFHGLLNSEGTKFSNCVPTGLVITVELEPDPIQQIITPERKNSLQIQSKAGWVRPISQNATEQMVNLRVNSMDNQATLIFRLYHYPDLECLPILKEVFRVEVSIISKNLSKPMLEIDFSLGSFFSTPPILILPERNDQDEYQILPGFEDFESDVPVYSLSKFCITPELFGIISPQSRN